MFPLINQGVDSTLEPAYFSDLKRLTEVEINPALNQQLILPEDGYDGFSKVTVNKVTASIDSNIIPSNIKEGVSILGLLSTYSQTFNLWFPSRPTKRKLCNLY